MPHVLINDIHIPQKEPVLAKVANRTKSRIGSRLYAYRYNRHKDPGILKGQDVAEIARRLRKRVEQKS